MTTRTFLITGDDEGPFEANGTAFCLGLGNVRPSEGHRLVVLGEPSQPGDISYSDEWLNSPTCVEVPDPALAGMTEQVHDPLWAARGLRSALIALVFNNDVRTLIFDQPNGKQMLTQLDAIVDLTHDLCTYEPPLIQEEIA